MNDTQQCIMQIFKVVDRLCEKHNLRYFAIGGTAIGAVRHEGFIPWDDDLDIAMPDIDYLRFLEIARTELPSQFELFCYQQNKTYSYIFSRVVDANTTFIPFRHLDSPESFHGVWIDIMPMSGFPEKRIQRLIHQLRIWKNLRLGPKMYLSYRGNPTMMGKVLWLLSRPAYYLFPKTYFYDKYFELIKKCPFDESVLTGYTWAPKSYRRKLQYPHAWFADYVLLPFEDSKIRCPVGIRKYLECQFGDYMVLPPEDERKPHLAFLDLSHSYKDYQKGLLSVPPSVPS